MKYFLIAGEPSGDMHGATLIAELIKNDPEAEIKYFGGDLMQAQGGQLLKHYNEMAFMGILPVLFNIRTIQKNFKACEEALLQFKPNSLILIDYPGFNLRMAKFAKLHGIPTSYYISPKVWAWKTKRVFKIKAWVDNMYTIFPFETNFFRKYDYEVTYVGNPVWDLIEKELQNPLDFNSFIVKNNLENKPIIALLAGSRNAEISLLLPIMEQVKPLFPSFQFVIAGAPNKNSEYYRQILSTEIPVVFNQTYDLLRYSRTAIVASGTATLETALLNVPQVVVYKMGMGWFLEMFRKQILKTDFFSLVNLVAEKEVVKELFQSEVTPKNIKAEIDQILNNSDYKSQMLNGYAEIVENLKSEGAAVKAAKAIIASIKRDTKNE